MKSDTESASTFLAVLKSGRITSIHLYFDYDISRQDEVRDFIKDKRFELSLHGLTEYQKAVKELDRLYEEQLKEGGE